MTVLNTVGGVGDPMPLSIRIPPDQHIPDVDFHPTSEALVSVALIPLCIEWVDFSILISPFTIQPTLPGGTEEIGLAGGNRLNLIN